MDELDLRILYWLQRDSAMPLAELASHCGLSPSPCWRRVQRLEVAGVIRRRVALLDPASVGVGVTVFVSVRTSQHKKAWAEQFRQVVMAMPEVIGFYRMAGEIDYLLHIVVPDIAGYDRVYNRLIERIDLDDVSAAFAMETIKHTTALPLDYAAP